MTLIPVRPLPILTIPVHSQDEQRLLALALRSADVADVVLDSTILRATDFYHEYHSRIYTTMRSLHTAGQPISIASVSLELRRRGWEDEAAYVFDSLLDCVHFSYGSEDAAAWIKALQQRRKAGELQALQKDAITAVESGDPVRMQAAYKALVNGISDTPKIPAGYTLYSYSSLLTLPQQRWLVEGEIPENGLSMLVGPSEGGKSFVMVDRALRVALAHPDQAVIYIAPEGGTGYRKRMDAWCQHHLIIPPENLYFILDTVPLLDDAKLQRLLASLASLRPVLIVVDTLARSMIGGDENSAKDVGLLIDACDQLRRVTGAAVQLVHHTGKNNSGYRGSSALFGACDVVVELANDDGLITLSCGKSKDSAHFEPHCLRLMEVDESCVIVPAERVTLRDTRLTQRQRAVLEALAMEVFVQAGAKASELIEILSIPRKSLYRAFDPLLRQGYVSQAAKGDPYFLTEKGRVSVCHDTPCDTSPQTATQHVGTGTLEAVVSAGIPHQDGEVSLVSPMCQHVSDTRCIGVSGVSHPVGVTHDTTLTQDNMVDLLWHEHTEVIMNEPQSRTITLRDGTELKELILTDEWQVVPAGWSVPSGADIAMDLNDGTKARLMQPQYDYELTRARELYDTGNTEGLAAFLGRQRGPVARYLKEVMAGWT